MIGKSGNSKSSTTYKYYRCNHLNNTECKKKSIGKEYIENLVVNKCKALLTDKNIDKIAKKIYDTCQQENNSNIVIKNLEKRKRQIKNNIENLMVALENGQHIEMISDRITQKEKELEEIQNQYFIEMSKICQLSEKEIKFFLTKLKNSDILSNSYRKVLIDTFVNAIYVYDNEIILIYNVGNKSITINIDLLSDIEKELATDRLGFLNGSVHQLNMPL